MAQKQRKESAKPEKRTSLLLVFPPEKEKAIETVVESQAENDIPIL